MQTKAKRDTRDFVSAGNPKNRFAKEGYQCKNCDTRRSRLQNGRWASYCGKCTTRFDVALWWKRVSKRLVRL